jgi:transposase
MGHRRGESRTQAALFPLMLEELVAQDALVRVVDAWVSHLDMKLLGFEKAVPQVRGAPPYDPADLLKLYVWGYLNSVRSSRELERECHRDVECMWLLGRLAPDHKTIANFRRGNGAGLVAACASFVSFAREHGLIAGKTVAIDGSKVRAVASRKAVTGRRQLSEEAKRNAQEIDAYLKLLDQQDEQEGKSQPEGCDVRRALAQLEGRQQEIQAEQQRLAAQRRTTLVQTEPDARVMRSLNYAPGYNLQAAVETKSHLIVAHAVTNDVSDQRQLQPMAEAASQALEQPCIAIADTGYSNAEHIAKLDDAGITTFVGIKRSGNSQGGGILYDRNAFNYDAQNDRFTCPAGKTLTRNEVHQRDKLVVYAAKTRDCATCANKPQCTNSRHREVTRHLYEDALRANAERLAQWPEAMQLRREVAEHPFASLKQCILGNARLLMRGLNGASSELSIAVLAYNLKRAFNMKGGSWMRHAMKG